MATDLFKVISEWALAKELIFSNQKIVVGVSGGPDSIFLLHLLTNMQKSYNLSLVVAHLDHGWRANSAIEAERVKNYVEGLGHSVVVAHAHDFKENIKKNGSLEETGRTLRRLFFEKLAQEQNAHAIALGHHADDQQETFFIRLMRGAHLSGLASILPKSGIYIRPLLATSKSDIVAYLQHQNIPFLEDPTNQSTEFLRNKIRLQCIPTLRSIDNRFDTNCLTAINALQEADQFIEQTSQRALKAVSNDANTLILSDFFQLHPFLQKRVALAWLITSDINFSISASFMQELLRFLSSPRGGVHILGASWRIVKKSGTARIEKF